MRSRLTHVGIPAVLAFLFTVGEAAAQTPRGPADEALEVHGHWTVTVVRDGEVVERREFQNALVPGGQTHLSQVLSGAYTPGPWVILVHADGTGDLCADNEFTDGEDGRCAISESIGETTVTTPATSTLLLEGTETVVRAANIVTVNTWQINCPAGVAVSDCDNSNFAAAAEFTEKALDAPIAVQAGDRIEVTVVISFS